MLFKFFRNWEMMVIKVDTGNSEVQQKISPKTELT